MNRAIKAFKLFVLVLMVCFAIETKLEGSTVLFCLSLFGGVGWFLLNVFDD